MFLIDKVRKLSLSYLLIAFFWGMLFEAFPVFEGERNPLDFIPITIVYCLLTVIFYFLYCYLNKWLVFIFAPILGIIMEFSFMRPDKIPFGDVNEAKFLAAVFFALAWSLILITPYFLTRWAEKSKKRLGLILIILILILFSTATTYWYKYCRSGSCQISEVRSPTVTLKEIEFYKGVSFLSASEEELQEAKNLGANIVEFGISVQQKEDEKWILSGSSNPQVWQEWQKKLSQEIQTANKLGMQAAITLWFSTSDTTKDPQEWLDQAKPLYEELGQFASQNNIYTIFIPGEVEIATGATCCHGKTGLEITANNEVSQEGFIYWSSKISQEIKEELRKNYAGRVVTDYITGNWWFEEERLVGPDSWLMADFYAIRSGVQLDDPDFDTDAGQTSEHRAKVVREVAKRSGVDKVIFSGPLANNLARIQNREFTFSEEQRRSLYEIFFQKTSPLVNGYFLRKFPPNLSDSIAEAVAKEWWEKLD